MTITDDRPGSLDPVTRWPPAPANGDTTSWPGARFSGPLFTRRCFTFTVVCPHLSYWHVLIGLDVCMHCSNTLGPEAPSNWPFDGYPDAVTTDEYSTRRSGQARPANHLECDGYSTVSSHWTPVAVTFTWLPARVAARPAGGRAYRWPHQGGCSGSRQRRRQSDGRARQPPGRVRGQRYVTVRQHRDASQLRRPVSGDLPERTGPSLACPMSFLRGDIARQLTASHDQQGPRPN